MPLLDQLHNVFTALAADVPAFGADVAELQKIVDDRDAEAANAATVAEGKAEAWLAARLKGLLGGTAEQDVPVAEPVPDPAAVVTEPDPAAPAGVAEAAG